MEHPTLREARLAAKNYLKNRSLPTYNLPHPPPSISEHPHPRRILTRLIWRPGHLRWIAPMTTARTLIGLVQSPFRRRKLVLPRHSDQVKCLLGHRRRLHKEDCAWCQSRTWQVGSREGAWQVTLRMPFFTAQRRDSPRDSHWGGLTWIAAAPLGFGFERAVSAQPVES